MGMDVLMLAEAAELPTSLAYIAATAAATTIVVLATRRRVRRSREGGGPTTLASAMDSTIRSKDASEEMRQLLIELQQFARETMAQIDNRTRKLEVLIRNADERLARLQSDSSGNLNRTAAPATGIPASPSGRLDVLVADNGDQMGPGGLRESNESERVDPSPATSSSSAPDRTPLDHAEIVDLAESGLSPVDIARKLDRPTGEVELVLSLASTSGR